MDRIPDPVWGWSWSWIADGTVDIPLDLLQCPTTNAGVISQPIIAVQNSVPPQQLPIAMALITFSQSFGAALFLSFAETIFGNSFATLIPQYAPSVNSQSVIDAGATAFRDVVSASDLAGVLTAYAISIDRVFYMAAALGAGCFAFAWGMGWQDMRKKKAVSKA